MRARWLRAQSTAAATSVRPSPRPARAGVQPQRVQVHRVRALRAARRSDRPGRSSTSDGELGVRAQPPAPLRGGEGGLVPVLRIARRRASRSARAAAASRRRASPLRQPGDRRRHSCRVASAPSAGCVRIVLIVTAFVSHVAGGIAEIDAPLFCAPRQLIARPGHPTDAHGSAGRGRAARTSRLIWAPPGRARRLLRHRRCPPVRPRVRDTVGGLPRRGDRPRTGRSRWPARVMVAEADGQSTVRA